MLTCQDPARDPVAVDERMDDLYGYQLHTEPGTPWSLRVLPVRFADPAGPYKRLPPGARPAPDRRGQSVLRKLPGRPQRTGPGWLALRGWGEATDRARRQRCRGGADLCVRRAARADCGEARGHGVLGPDPERGFRLAPEGHRPRRPGSPGAYAACGVSAGSPDSPPTARRAQFSYNGTSSRDRTRTYNLPVNSRTLCRLSYAGPPGADPARPGSGDQRRGHKGSAPPLCPVRRPSQRMTGLASGISVRRLGMTG